MRGFIVALIFLLPFVAHAQNIWKGAGLLYVDGVPTHDPGTRGAEVAIDSSTYIWYVWNRTTESWDECADLRDLADALSVGGGSGAIQYNDGASGLAGDNNFTYGSNKIELGNDLTNATISLNGSTDYSLISTGTDEFKVRDVSSGADRLVVTSSDITYNGTSIINTDDQTLSLSGDTLSIEDGNSVVLPAGGVTGSGTSGYVPYFTDSTEVGNSGLYYNSANGYLGFNTTNPFRQIDFVGSNMRFGRAGSLNFDFSNYQDYKTLRFVADANEVNIQTLGAYPLGFNVNFSRAITIVPGPSVGIGQILPTARIHVTGPGTTSLTTVFLADNASGTDIIKANDGGQVTIGPGSHTASSVLDVQSTTAGFLPPRMTGTQAEAISSPAEGLMVYSTDGSGVTITSKGWWGYDGSTWVKLN